MELEQKYLARTEDALTQALCLLQVSCTVSQRTTKIQHDVYYDTPDLLLFRRGASLRVRRKGKRYTLTLKDAGRRTAGRFSRREEEYPLHLPDPDLKRDTILNVFPCLPANAVLRPTVEVENTRTVLLLNGVVEAAFDHVTYARGGAPVGTELQLELESVADGGEGLLDELGTVLRPVRDLVPLTASKYQRAMFCLKH